MKKPFVLFSLLALFSIASLAQKPILVSSDSLLVGNRKHPSVSVTIPEVAYEQTMKNWTNLLEKGTKSKVTQANGLMEIFGATIKEISANTINIYSRLESRDSLLVLHAAFELSQDVFVEKATGETALSASGEKLRAFAKDQYLNLAKDQLNAEEKILRGLENDLQSLRNEKSRLDKSIQNNKNTISEEQNNLEIHNNNLTQLSANLTSESTNLSSMEEGAAREEKAKFVRELEKERKRTSNDIEASERKISKAKKEIDEAENEIPRNESKQEELNTKIGQQEAVVGRFTDKYNRIKAY